MSDIHKIKANIVLLHRLRDQVNEAVVSPPSPERLATLANQIVSALNALLDEITPTDIAEIPEEELLSDLKETQQDIQDCITALFAGISFTPSGSVRDRLVENRRIRDRIQGELARRGVKYEKSSFADDSDAGSFLASLRTDK